MPRWAPGAAPLDRALQGFLEALRHSLLELASARSMVAPCNPLIPLALVFAGMTAVSVASSLVVPLASLVSGGLELVYVFLRGGRVRLYPVLLVVGFTAAISAPYLLVGGAGAVALFVARVAACAVLASSLVSLLGWEGVVAGLRALGVPGEVVGAVEVMPRYIALLGGEAVRMLAARRARSLGGTGYLKAWRSLASVLAELLARSTVRAYTLSLAVSARRLSGAAHGGSGRRGSIAPALAASTPSIVAIAAAVAAHAVH